MSTSDKIALASLIVALVSLYYTRLSVLEARQPAGRSPAPRGRVALSAIVTILQFTLAAFMFLKSEPTGAKQTGNKAAQTSNPPPNGLGSGTSEGGDSGLERKPQAEQSPSSAVVQERGGNDDDIYGQENIFGAAHVRKAKRIVDANLGRTFCLGDSGWRMRFRKRGREYYLDWSYPLLDSGGGEAAYHTRIVINAFSDQYDAVSYRDLHTDGPRGLHFAEDGGSAQDVILCSDGSASIENHQLCSFAWNL